jgi:hypothetical protein
MIRCKLSKVLNRFAEDLIEGQWGPFKIGGIMKLVHRSIVSHCLFSALATGFVACSSPKADSRSSSKETTKLGSSPEDELMTKASNNLEFQLLGAGIEFNEAKSIVKDVQMQVNLAGVGFWAGKGMQLSSQFSNNFAAAAGAVAATRANSPSFATILKVTQKVAFEVGGAQVSEIFQSAVVKSVAALYPEVAKKFLSFKSIEDNLASFSQQVKAAAVTTPTVAGMQDVVDLTGVYSELKSDYYKK